MGKAKTVATVAAVAAGAAAGAAVGVYVYKKANEVPAGEPLHLVKVESAEPEISTLPLGIWLTVTDYAPGLITAEVRNASGATMGVGQEYWLEHLGEGGWELVEPRHGLTFGADTIVLEDLEAVTLTCDISAFEPLCAGSYRLCKTDLDAPFTLA